MLPRCDWPITNDALFIPWGDGNHPGVIFSSIATAAGPLGDTPNFSRIAFNASDSIGEIVAIGQDDLGFLWLGGRRGLARYDGYRIHTYKADPKILMP